MPTANDSALNAIKTIGEQNGDKLDTVTLRINVEPEMLKKMTTVISLYGDEIDPSVKKPELVSFFLKKGFESLIKTGEFDKRLKTVLGE